METPYLITTTGYPSAGKSQLVNYLTEEHNFTRLSTDQFRDIFYDQNFIELKDDIKGEVKESSIWEILQYSKFNFLSKGLDVVVDVTAPDNDTRKYLLSTQISNNQYIPAIKYLAWINTNKEIINQRNIKRGRNNNIIKRWDEKWENPEESKDYKIIKFNGNTPKDRENMFEILDEKFSRKGKIYSINK